MPHSIVAWWGFLVVGLFLSYSNSLWTVAYFSVSKWRRVYARSVFIIACTIPTCIGIVHAYTCAPFPLLDLLCEISTLYFNAPLSVKNSPPLSPWKGSSCFQRKCLQLHFTGKSIFLCFKYFTYRSSSYIVRKTPVTDYWEGNPCNTQIWVILNV